MRLLMLFIFLFIPCLSAAAADNNNNPWHSEVELGYVQTGGNTQTQTLNTRGELIFDVTSWRSTLKGAALAASDKQTTTAEKYEASLQEDYKFSERGYIFARAGFETDRFEGITRRLSETLGYGRILFSDDSVNWKFEIGGGGRQTNYTDQTRTHEAVGRSLTKIKWKINDASTFSQELNSEGGGKGFVSNSITALQHKLNSRLSSKISYAVQYNTRVPVGTQKTDTEMAVTLVWSY